MDESEVENVTLRFIKDLEKRTTGKKDFEQSLEAAGETIAAQLEDVRIANEESDDEFEEDGPVALDFG